MKKTLSVMLGLVAFLVIGLGERAWAGAKLDSAVVIDLTNHHAFGALGSARNSTDPNQLIGCRVTVNTSAAPLLECYANNSNALYSTGNYVYCYSSNASLAAVALGINGDSQIDFGFDPSSGTCTSLKVEQVSWWAPKK